MLAVCLEAVDMTSESPGPMRMPVGRSLGLHPSDKSGYPISLTVDESFGPLLLHMDAVGTCVPGSRKHKILVAVHQA